MNYAAMIQEEKLKKTFILATLVSTIVGTFTASMALVDKISEKRAQRKQRALDGKQDGQIKVLQEKVQQLSQENDQAAAHADDRLRRRRRRGDSSGSEDELSYNARRSRAMIERMYADNINRMGQQYAYGDALTENKLQAQIIQLQQTVINVLQDALYTGRDLTQSDLTRIMAAQDAAREGSLDALAERTKRMLAQRKALGYDPQAPDRLTEDRRTRPRRQSTLPATKRVERSMTPVRRARTLPIAANPLFCRYSDDLQRSSQALDRAFDPSGSGLCPACDARLPVLHEAIVLLDDTDYRVTARYIVKSHTPDGRFACILCHTQRSDVDCLCADMEALVKHIATYHTAEEAYDEVDLVEVPGGRKMLEYQR